MLQAHYRIESSHPMVGPLLPVSVSSEFLLYDRATAVVVVAAKSITNPGGYEIRAVDVRTGEIVYRKITAGIKNQ